MNVEKKRPAWWTPDASEAKSSRGEGLPTLEELVDAKPLGSRFLEESDAVSLAASSMSDEGDEIEDDEEDSEIDGEDDGSYQSGESDENF